MEAVCESVFNEKKATVDALDLPVPGYFRMRSHSYVRAIDQGCSQDEDEPLLPASPPRTTTTTVRTIQSSTGSSTHTHKFQSFFAPIEPFGLDDEPLMRDAIGCMVGRWHSQQCVKKPEGERWWSLS